MKTVFTILFAMALFSVNGQKLASVEIDKFTNELRVETEYTNLVMTLTKVMKAKLRSVGNSYFLSLFGTVGVGVVGTDDALVLLFEDKSTTSIYPTSVQSYDIGIGQYADDTYKHQYQITRAQLEKIRDNKVISIRRYFNKNYVDVDIKDKNAAKFSELAKVFLTEATK